MTCGCNGNGNDTVDEINVQQGTPISYVSSDACGTYSVPCSCSCVTITPENPCVQQSVCTSFPSTPPAPTPYYASICQESHTQTVVNNCFVAALKATNSFNMPASGVSTILTFTGLCGALVGSYLWNPYVGYLKITQVDLTNGQVTVTNENQSGNAAPGTAFAACMYFIVTIPPSSTGSSSGCGCNIVYLAADFTTPAVGTCIDVTVTTVAGLAVGKNVSIGTSTFRVSAIKSSTLITICNDGGAAAGVVVLARNSSNELQYQVILLDTNPCNNPQSNTGSLLVCNNGLSQPLHGTAVGQVPVLQNITTNAVEFETLNFEVATCTTLTTGIAFIAGTDTYTISVGSTTGFLAGDGVHVMGWWDIFLVDTILDGTHMIIKTNGTHVPVNSDVPCGTQICKYACCENLSVDVTQLQVDVAAAEVNITNIQNTISNYQYDLISNVSAAFTPTAIPYNGDPSVPTLGTTALTGNIAGVAVTNNQTIVLNLLVIVEGILKGAYTRSDKSLGWTLPADPADPLFPSCVKEKLQLLYGFSLTGPGYPTPTILLGEEETGRVICPGLYGTNSGDFQFSIGNNITKVSIHTLAPGQTLYMSAMCKIFYNEAIWNNYLLDPAPDLAVSVLDTRVTVQGIALV